MFECKTKEDVMRILPDWRTVIKEITGEGLTLRVKFAVAAINVERIHLWLEDLQAKNKTVYSIKSTDRAKGHYICYKQRLYCQHKTKNNRMLDPSEKRTRNTNCPSGITVTLRAIKKTYRGRNQANAPDAEMPCEVTFYPNHNHSTDSLDVLRLRRVSGAVKEKLLNLYDRGHSPSSALKLLTMDILLSSGNEKKLLVDRSNCPDYMFCYHFYQKVFLRTARTRLLTREFIVGRLEEYNREMGECCAQARFEEKKFVVCICPPSMKRAHKMWPQASEAVYLDSSGTSDDISRVFVLLANSESGGVPLGVIIVSSEKASLLSTGFELLRDIVGPDIFGGNVTGPKVFFIEDSIEVQKAVERSWEGSRCLWYLFHVLRTVWKELLRAKSRIPMDEQCAMFRQFRAIVYAETDEECVRRYKTAFKNTVEYEDYRKLLYDLFKRKEMWTNCHRDAQTYSHEVAMKALKTKILFSVEFFSILQMIDYVLEMFGRYYERRLTDAAHNNLKDNVINVCYREPPSDIDVEIINDHILLMPSDRQQEVEPLYYIINIDVLVCSCFQGLMGKHCKHVDWGCFLLNTDMYMASIEDLSVRQLFYQIATGKELVFGEECGEVGVGTSGQETAEEVRVRGQALVREILETFDKFLEKSPHEMVNALEIMKLKINLMEATACATACINF